MLPFDPEHTASFYNAYGERESARWRDSPRARMELDVYCHHLRARVGANEHWLDAGCGPGTFAKVLMSLGARVTCIDLSEVQLQACRALAPGAEAYLIGSVTDLSRFPDGSFDGSLAYGGPVSYCLDRGGDAVRELVRVTRPRGPVGISVMNLYGAVHRFLPGMLPIPVEVNRKVLESGDLPREVNEGHECHLFTVEEARALLLEAGLTDVELHASGWLIPNGEFEMPEPGTEAWTLLFETELKASAESPGAGTHIIAWGRAP